MPEAYRHDCVVQAGVAIAYQREDDAYFTEYNAVHLGLEETTWQLVGRPPIGAAFGAPVC
jgi:hypothetical protein